MLLKEKVAIVTGGGRGIGRATALRFAGEGALTVVADIDLDMATAVAAEINTGDAQTEPAVGQALPVQVDVTDQASVGAMVKMVVAKFDRVDILINNAGIVRDSQLVKMSEENFDLVVDVNLKGVFNCAQAVAPIMVNQGSGVILSTSSVVATYGNFGQTNYVASKAGVIGMTKVWARELGRKGVRANVVAPGFIKTRLMDGIPDKVMDKITERIPLGRLGYPEDIANAFAWLASDQASYINGHVLAVDGGTVV
jgi:3-oxoacyl-[acyl-carrier protein] reductase